jgi:hypothetical protein
MYRQILILFCVLLVALTLYGCGLVIRSPEECYGETPYTAVHDYFWDRKAPRPKASTKEEFLKDWGKPDEIITDSENKETWVYKRKLWCGIMPIIILPIPLILPVCDGFDRIDFTDNVATNLHTRHIVEGYIIMPAGKSSEGSACRFP